MSGIKSNQYQSTLNSIQKCTCKDSNRFSLKRNQIFALFLYWKSIPGTYICEEVYLTVRVCESGADKAFLFRSVTSGFMIRRQPAVRTLVPELTARVLLCSNWSSNLSQSWECLFKAMISSITDKCAWEICQSCFYQTSQTWGGSELSEVSLNWSQRWSQGWKLLETQRWTVTEKWRMCSDCSVLLSAMTISSSRWYCFSIFLHCDSSSSC